ncbi:MAG: putative 30S ribosomal subunit protein S6 [Candidatus Hodgkinia cicadicola]|nr:MAG: putative 30S ribosomal subunit protein S6 [Candidatus Hodgkinia cicadicola]
MTTALIYAVPNELKLVVINSTLILEGEYGRVQLNSLKLAVFVKRAKLVLRSNCMCYAAAKLTNAIKGALCGHVKWLRLNGVGYKALLIANKLELSLGFSHKLVFGLPHDVEATVFRANKLKLKSASLDSVAAAASVLKAKKRADAYKAKGIISRKVWG